uniref:NADH:ubiquinone reductase (H(+)-translocating) n=1 Tax=Rhabditophanes sp. KR3021 TaxID=114890 RepID=A0AC35UIH3_9BILA
KFNFFFNRVLFSFILILVTISVLVYSCYYLNGEANFYYYFFVLLVFVGRIFSLIFRNAIRAPTPVSSLVHRSTLVTAGLILLINFNALIFSKNIIRIVLVVGIFTIFFSRITALFEEDLKKVVALRTLSQIGFSIVTLGLGLNFIALIHLLSHALFKRCLFIQVGYLIHCSFGQQDGRNYNNLGNLPFFIQIQILVTLFCLCGLIFSRGAVRKDFILEIFFSNNFIVFFSSIFFIAVFITFGYSYHFYAPLIFLFLSFFIILISVKFILKEVSFKFLGDYLPKLSIYFLINIKRTDLFLNKLNL